MGNCISSHRVLFLPSHQLQCATGKNMTAKNRIGSRPARQLMALAALVIALAFSGLIFPGTAAGSDQAVTKMLYQCLRLPANRTKDVAVAWDKARFGVKRTE